MNTQAKHTPGPWEIEIESSNCVKVKSLDYGTISVLHDPLADELHRTDELIANALVQAAAPELLEARQEWLANPSATALIRIQVAVAKATGAE